LTERVVRRTEDLTADTDIDGAAVKAVMLQASREGAEAFLRRVAGILARANDESRRLQFAQVEVAREARHDFLWKPEELVFNDLELTRITEGMSHV
jgi:hypothetical protein